MADGPTNLTGRTWALSVSFNTSLPIGPNTTLMIVQDGATGTLKYMVGTGLSVNTGGPLGAVPSASLTILSPGLGYDTFTGMGGSASLSAGNYVAGQTLGVVTNQDLIPVGTSFGSSVSPGFNFGVTNTKDFDLSGYYMTDLQLQDLVRKVNEIIRDSGYTSTDTPLNLNVMTTAKLLDAIVISDLATNKQFLKTAVGLNDPNAPLELHHADGSSETTYFDAKGRNIGTVWYDKDHNVTAYSTIVDNQLKYFKVNADGSQTASSGLRGPAAEGGPERVEIHDSPSLYEEYHFNGTHLTWSIVDNKTSGSHSYTYNGLDGHKISNIWSPTYSEYREDTPDGNHIYRKSDDAAGTRYSSQYNDYSVARSVLSSDKYVTEYTNVDGGGNKSHIWNYASGRIISETSTVVRVASGTSYSDRETKLTHRETNDGGTLILDQSWWPSTGYQKYYYSFDSAGTRTTQETTENGITYHRDVYKANGDFSLLKYNLGSLRGHTDVYTSGTSGSHDVQDFVITAQGSQAQMLERRLDTNAGTHSHVVYQPDGKMVLNEQSDDIRHTSTVERYWANGKMQSQDIVNADKSESHRTWGEDSRPLKDLELRSDGSKTYTEWYAGTFQTKLADAYDKSGQLIQHTTYWENGRYQEQDTVNADHSASYTSFDQNSFITKQILVKADGSETVKTNFASSNTAQTVDTFDPAGNPVSHTVNNASGQWTVQDSFAPNSHDLVSHQVRDPSTNNGQTYFFDNGEVHREMLTYSGTNQFVFDVTPQDGKLLINGPIAPSSFNTLYQFERGHLDAFDGLIDGRISVAPGLSVGIDNPNIANAITARVAALDAGTGGAFHDQHLADTQALVSDYLKASLAHDYHL